MITHKWGRGLFEAKFNKLTEAVSAIKDGNASLQNAIATLYFNLSVTQVETFVADKTQMIARYVTDFLCWAEQADAILRGYQAVGNLLTLPSKKDIGALIKNQPTLIEKITENSNGIGTNDYHVLQETAKCILNIMK